MEAVPTLSIQQLTKRFGDVTALDSMSFDVESGEIFGFVGSNGAGKTTTMRIALGVLAADSGQVLWQGRPLDMTTRRTVGYMPEERGLYPRMKVGQQLVYLAQLHGLSHAHAVTAMEHWTDRLGLAARRLDEVMRLSLGNQQRVQLAAALIHSPAILVLDEPFSGLDPIAVDVMSAVLREQADRGVPVLFSSHQLDLVERLCDRVGIVRAGRVEAQGTIDSLRATAVPRWEVVSELAPPGWAAAVPGIAVVSADGPRTVFEVSEAGAEQHALAAALSFGPIRAFGEVRSSLTDLFRHVVSETAELSPLASSSLSPNKTSSRSKVKGGTV